MPSKTVEIVLITLILFFIYSFSINLFLEIISKNSLDEDIAKYIYNNFLLCLTITNFSYGSLKCILSFEYNNLELISEEYFSYVRYNNKYFYPNISLFTTFNKKIYVIANEEVYLKNNIENITIS